MDWKTGLCRLKIFPQSTRFADFLGVKDRPFGGFLDEVGGDAFGEVEDFV